MIDCLDVNQSQFPDYIRVDNITPRPGIGWAYANGTFSAPPVPAPSTPPPQTVYTQFGFRSLFGLTELVAIDNCQASTTLTTDQKAVLYTIIKNFEAASEINVKNPATIQGIDYLANVGLITVARATQILAGGAPAQLAPGATGIPGATGS